MTHTKPRKGSRTTGTRRSAAGRATSAAAKTGAGSRAFGKKTSAAAKKRRKR